MLRFLIPTALLVFLMSGCASQTPQPAASTATATPVWNVTLLPGMTQPSPTATTPLIGSPTPTPHPTDENALRPLLRSQAEAANLGQHFYSYDCYAWAPCSCLLVVPSQIEISFDFAANSVDLQAGDYTQTYLWSTSNVYTNTLGTLATQLTFFEDGFELYTAIDNRSCTQERYRLQPENP